MKIESNEKCHACPWVLASVLFRYSSIPPLLRGVPAIPSLFGGVPAIPLVFRVPLFRVPMFLVL